MEAGATTSLNAEVPVFVTERPHRRVVMRAAVISGAMLILAWLIALILGALGFSTLPGLSLAGGSDPAPAGTTSAPRTGPAGSTNYAPAVRAGAKPTARGGPPARSAARDPKSTSASMGTASGSDAASGGSGSTSGSAAGGATSYGPGTTGDSASGGSTGTGSASDSAGNGRGAPTEAPSGGRGAPDTNPVGQVTDGNAHALNPNAVDAGSRAGANRQDPPV